MKFPNLPFLEKKEKPQYFLSLIFRTDKLDAFVFQELGKTIKVVSEQEEFFQDSLEKADFEEILDVSDKVISAAEDELNLTTEVSKTIFGLKDSWVENGKIKKEYLDILKKLCESLGLTPVGFLTIPEAVVGLLQEEEGAPPSAILVDVSKNRVNVSLVKAGKIVEAKSSEIHETSVFTVDTLLKHFEVSEILPSKIVLLSEDEDLVQEFISHQWSKSLPFLHLPQITNLLPGFMGKAFVLGIATQMGAQVRDEFEAPSEEPIPAQPNIEQEQAEEEKVEVSPVEEKKETIEYLPAEYFGFMEGKDVGKVPPPQPKVETNEETEAVIEEIPEEVKLEEENRILPATFLAVILPKVKKSLSAISKLFKTIPISKVSSRIPFGLRNIFILAAFVFFLLLVTFYYFLGLKANVTLGIKPQIIEKSQDITFSSSSNFANNTIKGDLVSVSEDGTASTNATGKKETGDKAKGTVTVFNSSITTITFPAQTIITSNTSTKLNFLTTAKVTVASRSADVPPTAGTAIVNVEAEKFGTEYNLPSGTKFLSISGNSDVSAKNDNPFSGGTKKEITAVSKDDLNKLQNDLQKQLEGKAKDDINKKLSQGKSLLSDFVNVSFDKKDFDKNVDDEASKVNLKATLSFQTISYDKKELLDYIKATFQGNTTIDEGNVEISFENIKLKNNNDVSAKMKLKAKIIPSIDKESLAKEISGKSFTSAANRLKNIPQVVDVKIKFSPNIPLLPKFLPRIPKNIRIIILENA